MRDRSCRSIVGILNTQVGDRYIFSGSAINTPAVASADDIMNGTATQVGLKQVISERQQADLGTSGLGRLVITSPTPTSVQVAEDVAGSPFGFKLSSVTSSLTGATVTGPAGSPAAISVSLGATNPNPGDQVSLTFNLPDGSTESIQLTATTTTPPPTGSFTIGATPTATAANLNAALNSSIGTLANTALVAASAVAAGDNFFNTDGTATGTAATNNLSTPAAITGSTALQTATNTELVKRGICRQRHHHGGRSDTHLCGLGRLGRAPDQRHRQRPDAALQNRRAHRHLDALDHLGRRDHAAHR